MAVSFFPFYPKLRSASKIRAIFGEYNWFVRRNVMMILP
ncbi:hypothetical protein LEP1GSC061_3130 [Leptospira wolffii serovar Khorat str. Khorat-H2]|nr:hypothetical protein LEP1GSC061_3130 [Leptospira wolffii serovar Khorat str. Khorat-H2]